MQYLMRTSNDCGPAALSAVTNLSYEQVMAAWGTFRGNRSDSPWHHDWVMARLGVRRRIVTCGEIVSGACPPGRSVVLLHDRQSPLLTQHWAVLVGGAEPGTVRFDMGTGAIKQWTHAEFAKIYAGATPACAYVVCDGEVPTLTWYRRLYCWLTTR
jgi:hypothetical protein